MLDQMTDTQFAQLVGGLALAWLVAGLLVGHAIGVVIHRNDEQAERAYQRLRMRKGRQP
jgi:hypothetical protein